MNSRVAGRIPRKGIIIIVSTKYHELGHIQRRLVLVGRLDKDN